MFVICGNELICLFVCPLCFGCTYFPFKFQFSGLGSFAIFSEMVVYCSLLITQVNISYLFFGVETEIASPLPKERKLVVL